jgi:regulator of protease activity HflC (stomatin/prohibitin superfamily)
MIWILLLAVITLVVVVIRMSVAHAAKNNEDLENSVHYWTWGAIGGAALTVIVLLLTMIVSIGTRNIGIETAFGKPVGHLSNGMHLVWPWVNVTEIDAAIQTVNYTGNSCLDVRIANQQSACVDVSIRYRIEPDAADELFANYHSNTNQEIQDSLVARELHSAVNTQLETYDPSAGLLAAGSGNNNSVPTLASYAGLIQNQMIKEIGSQIKVLSVFIPFMHYDPATTNRINALQQQIYNTKIAQQSVQTAKQQALANQQVSNSSLSQQVLTSRCLDIMAEMVKQNQAVPVNMCALSGNVAGIITK